MFCGQCGTENDDGAAFCQNCGVSLKAPSSVPSSSEQPIQSSQYDQSQPRQYPPRQDSYQQGYGQYPLGAGYYQPDEIHPVAYVCAFCVPIAGIVIWALKRNEKPKSAKNILIVSIIGFAISFLFAV